jgi:glyoxylase-like metal-dependent hydrolase (beta-lactamase superfamily II)
MKKKAECVVVGALETNCWLYPIENNADTSGFSGGKRPCVVIDPGDESGLIVSRLRELDWTPRCIFLTHGHFDHLAALPDLLNDIHKMYAHPKIGIHRLDAHYLGKAALKAHRDSFSAAGGSSAYVDALWKPLPGADILFEEGTCSPFRVLHLPGHTPGSVGFYDEKAGILFSGDTLFQGNWGRTDLPGGSWDDLKRSLTRLFSLNEDITVFPGHGPETTIKAEMTDL